MNTCPKIVLVDDDESLIEVLSYTLKNQGYQAINVTNGPQCLELFQAVKPDLILLEVILSGMSGLDVCRELRRSSHVPIIMLTTKAAEEDRIIGLEAGADDYIVKPFSMKELLLRIKNLLRRRSQSTVVDPFSLQVGDFLIIPEYEVVVVRGKLIHLSPKEFQLLYFLATNDNQIFTREALLQKAWPETADQMITIQNVNVHIHQIREKIEQDSARPRHLLTVRGTGYIFTFGQGK